MNPPTLPSPEHVRSVLNELTFAQTKRLAELSTVPFTTLWKVRTGETSNPGLGTVGQFWPHIGAAQTEPATT